MRAIMIGSHASKEHVVIPSSSGKPGLHVSQEKWSTEA
jgi:hypothetical protein